MKSFLFEFFFCFLCIFLDMRQVDGGVKFVEYGQGDGDVDKDGLGVFVIDIDLDRIVFWLNCFECIYNLYIKVIEK